MTRTLVVLAALALAGCDAYGNACVERGASFAYAGSASYTGQIGTAATPIAGATPTTIVMDDFDPFDKGDCVEEGIEFTVQVGGCSLWLVENGAAHDTGKNASQGFLHAGADLEPGQTCVIATDAGAVTMTVDGGGLDLENGGTAALSMAGAITDGKGHRGYLKWSFTGQ